MTLGVAWDCKVWWRGGTGRETIGERVEDRWGKRFGNIVGGEIGSRSREWLGARSGTRGVRQRLKTGKRNQVLLVDQAAFIPLEGNIFGFVTE